MTTAYLHLTDTDKPKSQTAITASFVDENGKHVDIGGGGTTEIHTDNTLAGTGTTGNPLTIPAIKALVALPPLSPSDTLATVIAKVNKILDAAKTPQL